MQQFQIYIPQIQLLINQLPALLRRLSLISNQRPVLIKQLQANMRIAEKIMGNAQRIVALYPRVNPRDYDRFIAKHNRLEYIPPVSTCDTRTIPTSLKVDKRDCYVKQARNDNPII